MNCKLCSDVRTIFWTVIVFASVVIIFVFTFCDYDEGLLSSHQLHAIDAFFRKPPRKLLSRKKLLYDLSKAASLDPKAPHNEKCSSQKLNPVKCENKEGRKVILVMSFGFEVDTLGQWIDD